MATSEDDIVINASCRIRLDEIKWRFSGSGGPGGQHANTANTRVELLFDIGASASLTPRQKERLESRFGQTIRVVASDERSQTRNRDLAVSRFQASVAEALKIQRPRHPSRPTKASKERRLQDKQLRSQTKSRRQTPEVDN